MNNIKLQVGEDYLNRTRNVIHIISYSNVDNLFRDEFDNSYTIEGKAIKGFDLIFHLPKVSKEPTKEQILEGFEQFKSVGFTYFEVWVSAISWYKQQIK